MPEVPKIVHHRLRATTPAQDSLLQTHPEADVLTAFAEQALPSSEREGVLQHLALCGDCRDVVALALPAVDAVIHPAEEETEVVATHAAAGQKSGEHKNWFGWSGLGWAQLRWATLAAGIAVAVFVMRPALERIGKPHTRVNSAASQTAPVPATQIAAGTLQDNSVAAKGTVENREKSPEASAAKDVESNLRAGGKFGLPSHPARATAAPPPQSGMQLASNMAAGESKKESGGVRKDVASAGSAAQPAFELRAQDALSKSESDKSAVGKSSEVVNVVAGAPIETTPSPSSNEMVQTESAALQSAPAIEKAKKPALDEMAVNEPQNRSTQKALPSPMAAAPQAEVTAKGRDTNAMKSAAVSGMITKQAATWTIKDGILQRSLDGGQTWQRVARADKALLCYASRGLEMWAGGQAGTLLHSADDGMTWRAVAVSFHGQPLSSAITQIDARSPTQIVLSTDNHENWSSADGGKTWDRK